MGTEQTIQLQSRKTEWQEPELAWCPEPVGFDQGRTGEGVAEGQLAGCETCPEAERSHGRKALEAGIAAFVEERGEKRQATLSGQRKQQIQGGTFDAHDQQRGRRRGGEPGNGRGRGNDEAIACTPGNHDIETADRHRCEQDQTPGAVAPVVNGMQ